MPPVRAKIVEGGRLLVPAAIRRAMKLQTGDTVVMELTGDELRIRTADAALRRLQARVKAAVGPNRSLVDELIAERRAEAAHD
ncbi:MAG: AbrB/MazE/SpoVT family DNA-binding domain-containing protein [Caulobacteraceae bacterium]